MSEPAPVQAEPVCPRHPDRVAYVRCQRCGRPTCPECQRPAAVGIQCVDCVREGQKSMRAPRTQFGAKVSQDGRPVVTLTIIGICVAVWLLQRVSDQVTAQLAFEPMLGRTEPWRFLTAAFAHSPSSLLHILFNMYALWILGQYLEPMLGRIRFAALYLVSALGASVSYLLMASPPATVAGLNNNSSWVTPMVGASGAVFGLFGALIVFNRHLGRSSRQLYILLVINVVIGFVPGIAWQAHVGGFFTGAAVAAVITATAPQNRRRLQLPALVLVLVLLAVAATAKYALVDDSVLHSIVGLNV
jgi:membrane associated rhomboid family serine protease